MYFDRVHTDSRVRSCDLLLLEQDVFFNFLLICESLSSIYSREICLEFKPGLDNLSIMHVYFDRTSGHCILLSARENVEARQPPQNS